MADTINKPSIQIRSGLPSPLPDKSPSPATKLLISHGKPNFTIARSNSTSKDNANNPLSPQPTANNNYNAYKSAGSTASNYNNNISSSNGYNNSNSTNKFVVGTKFNGVFKPSNAAASWAGASASAAGANSNGNEAAQVVLRRPKLITQEEPQPAGEDDANVPEFIRRQRRIQERLAKENVLDFENRRSGYFTHVMISPDSPNRTSFVETMASPAIVPALEMPLPAKIEEEPLATNGHSEPAANGHSEAATNGHSNGHSEQQQLEQEQVPVPVLSNGHSQQEDVAPEEVAKAIEEVNKAVAGEDEAEEEVKVTESEPVAVQAPVEVVAVTTAAIIEPESAPAAEQNGHTNGHSSEDAITISHTNGHANEQTNGHANGDTNGHANGPSNGHSEEPSLPTPDPSGALGVNYEPKTVVSFSQELGGGENNYPDTVKVTKDAEPKTPAEAELQELSKLKFDIKNDAQNEVQVTPVLRAE